MIYGSLKSPENLKFMADSFKQHHAEFLNHNRDLYYIDEGDLLPYVKKHLKSEMGEQSYKGVESRIAPINLLAKIVDKKSKIYQQSPVRTVSGKGRATVKEKEIVTSLENQMRFNDIMNYSNENFNRSKSVWIEPFPDKGKAHLRAIPNHLFLVWSSNDAQPNEPTHVAIYMGNVKIDGEDRTIYRAYSDTEFVIFDSKGELRWEMMADRGNPDGINPVGALPGVYANRSKSQLIPTADTALLTMTILIPVLISDLNFAHKFSCFSIMWGIGVDKDKLRYAPNAFWELDADPKSAHKPEIGLITPNADIDKGLNLIQGQIALWLTSLSIKPGSIGQLTESNFASGISKMIDEMDTVEDRKAQVAIFASVEAKLWELILHRMYPYWVQESMVENIGQFPIDKHVETTFAEQIPLVSRGDLVNTLKSEKEAGFISRRSAMKKLNPEWTDEQIEAEIEAIMQEQAEARKVMQKTFGDNNANDEEE